MTHAGDERRVRAIAQIACIDRASRGNRILPPERGDQRHTRGFAPFFDQCDGVRVPMRAADDRHRTLRLADHVMNGQRIDDRYVLRRPFDPGAGGALDHVAQHVFRQRQNHRPRPSAHRRGIGAGDIFRDARGIIDSRSPFGERGEHGLEIDLLKGFAVARAPVDIADEQDHRLRILARDMHADRGVGRAWPARDEGDARSPGQLAVGTGHEGHAALLSARHQVDGGRVVQRVEHRQETLPRHGEDTVAPLFEKRIDKQASAGFRGHGPQPSRGSFQRANAGLTRLHASA